MTSSAYKIFDGPHVIDLKRVPWQRVIKEIFYVILYQENDRYLFVPKFNSTPILLEAFDMANDFGRKKVFEKEWKEFDIVFSHREFGTSETPWPYVSLIPTK